MKKILSVLLVLTVSIASIGQKVSIEEVRTNIGQTVTVCGKIIRAFSF